MTGDRRAPLALLVGLFAPAGALTGHALVHALEAAAPEVQGQGVSTAGRWWAAAGAVALLLAVAAALLLLVRRANGRGRRRLPQGERSLDFCARLWWRLAVLQLVLCGAASMAEAFVVAREPLHGVLLTYAAFAQGVTALLVAAVVRVVATWAGRLRTPSPAPWAPPLADPWQPSRTQPVRRCARVTVPLGLRAPPVSL